MKKLAQLATRLGVIATDQCLAFSLCKSKEDLETCIRNKSDEIHSIARTLLSLARKGGQQ